jgi:CDP-diacylglycerol--serine O-phosphatidyltransferase
MLTLTAVVCGLTAIRLAQEGKYGWATLSILGAAVLDFADGLAARKLAAESAFGAELDTLADFLNFGVAPALLLYDQNLLSLGDWGWTIAAIYVLAAGFRLARFNVRLKGLSENAIDKVFCGVPSTAAAVAVVLVGALVNAAFEVPLATLLAALSTIAASALMISSRQVPTLAALLAHICKTSSRD